MSFIVRCPRCGSMDAESVEDVGVEFCRMQCDSCGHGEVVDDYELKDDWNEMVEPDDPCLEHWWILPRGRFTKMWRALGVDHHGRPTFDMLRAAHDEPHRAYHTARHIGTMLGMIDRPEVEALADRPVELEAAIWFHDAVYDTHASDNEEKSAQLATEALLAAGVASDVVLRICALILSTKDHVAGSADAGLLIDVDLSILGAQRAAFETFEAGIRKEYEWVPDEQYRAGRSAVLAGFMKREFIYVTSLFRARFESPARQNLADALKVHMA